MNKKYCHFYKIKRYKITFNKQLKSLIVHQKLKILDGFLLA